MRSDDRKHFRSVQLLSSLASEADIDESYSWRSFLEESVLGEHSKGNLLKFDVNCSNIIVPASIFYLAPFREYMEHLTAGVIVEVALDGDYSDYVNPNIKLYWIASIQMVAGYRLLLRYEGMTEDDADEDFWINIGSTDIRPIGYCANNPEIAVLIPPESIQSRQSNWKQYLMCRIHAMRSLLPDWPQIQIQKLCGSRFKKGMRVELLDSVKTFRVRPARIEDVVGCRVFVKIHKKDISKDVVSKKKKTSKHKSRERGDAEDDEKDSSDNQIEEGVWLSEDSPLLFPVGWAMTTGYSLSASEEYVKHTKKIADSIIAGSSAPPYARMDAKPLLFQNFIENPNWKEEENRRKEAGEKMINWEKGMKLEVLDPLDSWKDMRVASVLDVLPGGYLKIGFDGEEIDPIPLHCASPLLFPAGYCKKYGVKLRGPKDKEGDFEWADYLQGREGLVAPDDLFEPVPLDEEMSNFKIGAKLEAVDKCEPHLICVATIANHRGRLLEISYDGWSSEYNQYFDYRSSEIFPAGWCEMHGYKLEAPVSTNKGSPSENKELFRDEKKTEKDTNTEKARGKNLFEQIRNQ